MPENILKASCTSARHAGSFDCLMASLILITMDNGRGHCAWWQSCTVPYQTHRGNKKKRKMYAIKQIKICAEYRDMLPRPRLDLSGTPGLRPIGLSPGSWQTSLGLGSMSRYSAQILICIANLPVRPPAPKKHDSWVSSPSAGSNVLDPNPSDSGHFPQTWKPVSLHNQHHTLPQRIWNKTRAQKYSLRIISKFGNLSYHINLPENESRECWSCWDGRSPRVESTATIT